MPYHLEKGPLLAPLESLYADQNHLRSFLEKLWAGGPAALGSLGALTSSAYNNPNNTGTNATGNDRRDSMRRDWFGESDAQPQPAFGRPFPPAHPKQDRLAFSTGYWSAYYGDVREIVGQTLMRAAEVALGAVRPPGATPAATPTRAWPVEFFWKCGQPRFEGWVTWRDKATGGSGQVTVIFATPATPDQVLSRPGDKAVAVDPMHDDWNHWQGMWITSHERHVQHVMITSAPTGPKNWIVPLDAVLFTEGTGAVATWQPAFGAGGAHDINPKPFTPGAP